MKRKLFPIFTLIILLAQSYSPLLFTVLASIEPTLENETQVEATLPVTEAPVDPTVTTEPTATAEPTTLPTDEPTTQATEEPTITPTEADTIGEILDGISTQRPEVVPTPVKDSYSPLILAKEFEIEILENTLADTINEDTVTVNSDGSATITTDKADYAPTDTVLITGNGFLPDISYLIEITSETGNYLFSDVVITDSKGEIIYAHQLDGTYRPFYRAEVKDSLGRVVAFVDFTDSRVINSVTLNGGSSVSVAPNAIISALVNVTTDGNNSNNDWRCTSWRIGNSGSFQKVDHGNEGSSGNHDVTFDIVAPASPGTYDVSFIAYSDDNCNSGASQTKTLSNAVTVLPPVTNPILPQACGLDIALVIDNSTSIDSTEMTQIKNAMTAFTGALNGTPTWFSVTRFATTASISQAFTSNISLVNSAINGIPVGGGFTNWQDGFVKAQSTFDPRIAKPNLVIFASDGNPNRTGTSGTSVTESVAVANAKVIADQLKTNGIRILAIGVGSDLDTDNMKTISGPNVNTGNVLTSDVITSNFTELAEDLAEFASQTCGGTISVNKYIGSVSEANRAGAGWEFDIAGITKTTDSNGQTDAVEVNAGTNYSVVETNVLSGYSYKSATCKNQTGQNVGSSITNGVGSISISDSDIISCDFVNDEKPTLTVNKNLNPTGHGAFNLLINGQSYANNVGNGGTTGAVALNPGNYIVSEEASNPSTNLSDYKVQYGGDCDAQGNVSLSKGDNKICTITNTAYGSVTITKDVVPNDSSLWNFTLNGTGGNYSKNNLGDGQSHTFMQLVPGSYTLNEITSSAYGTSITCDNVPGVAGSNEYLISLSAGQNVNCTITNTLKVADLGLVKIANQATYMRGDTVTYTLTVTNYGPNTAVNSSLTDNIPAGLTFVSVNTTQGSCSENLGTVSCNFGDILKDGIVTVTVVATVNSNTSGDILNTGSVSSSTPDSNTQNNSDDETIKVVYLELDVSKSDSPDPVYPGQEITYTINWSVTGNTQAKDVKLVEVIDDTLVTVDLADPQNAGWTACGDNFCYAIGDKDAPANGSVIFVVTVVKPVTATTIPNTVELYVDAPLGDTELKDIAQASTEVLQYGAISGYKYDDKNGNGSWNEGDTGLQTWTIFIDANNDNIANPGENTDTTDENGYYYFANLLPGTYKVCEVLNTADGWDNKSPLCRTVDVTNGNTTTNTNFFNFKCVNISGLKWEDLNGDGDKDAGEPVVSGVTINLTGADTQNTTTNEKGEYSFRVCNGGNVSIDEINPDSKVWYKTYPASDHDLTLVSGGTYNNYDFGNAKYAEIYGYKYRDHNGDGVLSTDDLSATLSGWIIELYDGLTNALIGTYETLADGYYEFTGLLAGREYYVLEKQHTGWTQTFGPIVKSLIEATSGSETKVEFANFENMSIKVCKLEDADGSLNTTDDLTPVQNWSVSLVKGQTKDTQTTGIDGCYTWTDLGPGSYAVEETVSNGWTALIPTSHNFGTIENGKSYTYNFVNTKLGSISGMKYEDLNANGVKDAGEPAISGIKICLESNTTGVGGTCEAGEPSTTTNASGEYSFTNLNPGTYHVTEEIGLGGSGQTWYQSYPGTTNSYRHANIFLTSGESEKGYNFGNYKYSKICYEKFNDLNGNGVKDTGEPDMANWMFKTYVLNDAGAKVELSGINGSGSCRGDIMPGKTYYVSEVLQNGWTQTTPGGDGYAGPFNATSDSSHDAVFGNVLKGDVTIYKKTVGGDDKFAFQTSTLPGGNFDLTTVSGSANKSFDGILAGLYSVTEVLPNGWDLTALICSDPDKGSSVDLNTGIATIDLDAGESITCTFTNTQRGSITAHKFQDDDLNMQQGIGEVDLKDWEMTLYTGSGCVADNEITSGTTNTDGDVPFGSLVPGTYSVSETLKAGYQNTTPVCQNLTLDAGENDTVNFGNYVLGEIKVCKYNDTNGDGLTAGDSKLSNWTINLVGPGDYDESKITGVDGCVTFDDLRYGRYTYSEDLKDGWVETIPVGGRTYTVPVDADHLTHNLVLTNYRYGLISGMKFEDKNDNGVKDPTEPGLKDWTINLDKNADGSVDSTTKTDADGNYSFTKLEYGTYRVREVQQNGWKQTTTNPADINISSGVESTGNNFGNFKYGTIEVMKYEDMDYELGRDIGDPFIGDPTFTFRLYKDNGSEWALLDTEGTDGTGKAIFESALTTLGKYFVCEVKVDGWEDMRSLNNPANNESGETDEYDVCEGVTVETSGYRVNVEFGNVELGTIEGMKWNDINGNGERDCEYIFNALGEYDQSVILPQDCEPKLENWKIFIDENDNGLYDDGEESVLTNGSGEYSFEDLLPGTYTVCEEEQSGWYRTYPEESNCHDVVVNTNGDFEVANFGNYEGGSIRGWKYRDVNGNGELDWEEREAEDRINKLNDWTIKLYNSDWEVVKSMETGDDDTEAGNVYKGQFKFINLKMGEYYICEELKEDWIQTEPSGMYEFKPVEFEGNEQDNCYPVEIDRSGQDVSGLYFGNFELGEVEGYKWDDLDGDGEWDEDEPKLENWTIELTKLGVIEEPIEERSLSAVVEPDETQTTQTDEDGYYEFEGLTAGEYRVCEVQQEGWMQTAPFQDSPDVSIILEEEEGEDEYYGCWTFTVLSGTEERVDFGNFKLGMIEGFKWNDVDGDGVKDTEEPKLSGWEIQLWDEKLPEVEDDKLEKDMEGALTVLIGEPGNKIGTPIKTDSNGNFIFKDLETGVYYVSEVLQSGWIQKHPVSPAYYRVVIDESGQVVENIAFGNQEIPVPTPTPGRVLGEDTPRVLGALAPTGRSVLISLLVGWSFIVALAVLETKTSKQKYS